MSISPDREKMLSEMTRAEKAELLEWIVRDLSDDFPGIESTPDVMGGVPASHAQEYLSGFLNRLGVWEPAMPIYYETIQPSLCRISLMPGILFDLTERKSKRR